MRLQERKIAVSVEPKYPQRPDHEAERLSRLSDASVRIKESLNLRCPSSDAYRSTPLTTSGVTAGTPSAKSALKGAFTKSGAARMYDTHSSSARA